MGGRKETEEAVNSAHEAFKVWSNTTGDEKSKLLEKVYYLMEERKEQLAKIITLENGKSLADSNREVMSAMSYIKWYAEEAKRIYGDTLTPSQKDKHLMVIDKPVGVVGAITPWNFPLSMITRKIAPAIAAGCTIVLKPALETPLSAIEVFKCFHDAGFPKGVVNLVIGEAKQIGGELTSNKKVRKIAFTGSTPVGKLLLKQSADTVKKTSMELGGHAPYIVFEDADLDLAIDGVLASKFSNSGQACISTNRIYVQNTVAKEFEEKLTEKVSKLKVGNGFEEEVSIGPLINEGSFNKMVEQVEDAKKNEGVILFGGNRAKIKDNNGYFFEPTIISQANENMKIAFEETFGPIAPVFSFETESEVIEKANNSDYGLAAYCFTNNLGRSFRVLEQLDYGIIGINDPAPITIQAPFGGFKESGMGKEGGKYGLEEYLEKKYVSIRKL